VILYYNFIIKCGKNQGGLTPLIPLLKGDNKKCFWIPAGVYPDRSVGAGMTEE